MSKPFGSRGRSSLRKVFSNRPLEATHVHGKGAREIVAPLGGGMGEVYRARDTRWRREVAVKVLPLPFRRIRNASRGSSRKRAPNILAGFDIGTYDRAAYIVFELLEGDSLRERLSHGTLPIRKAVEAALQIARALAAAHEKGMNARLASGVAASWRSLRMETKVCSSRPRCLRVAAPLPDQAAADSLMRLRRAEAPGIAMGSSCSVRIQTAHWCESRPEAARVCLERDGHL